MSRTGLNRAVLNRAALNRTPDRVKAALCLAAVCAGAGIVISQPFGTSSANTPPPKSSVGIGLPAAGAQASPGPSAPDPDPAPTAGQRIGTITIPRLWELGHPYRFTVEQGVDHDTVLNSGAVGHYADTELPGVPGNVGLAAHRNTHGEPFRYINELAPGDTVLISTAHASYRYVLDRELARTDPDNYQVLDPVPTQAGYHVPGQYLTLTTCTPAFTSEYRLIWWGHLMAGPTLPGATK